MIGAIISGVNELYRLELYPGAHVFVLSDVTKIHLDGLELRKLGFEIRDKLIWINDGDYVHILMARKPIEDKLVTNVETYNCGGLNIDRCRVGIGEHVGGGGRVGNFTGKSESNAELSDWRQESHNKGRFPTNIILQNVYWIVDKFPYGKSVASKTHHDKYEGESHTKFIRGYSNNTNQRDDEGSNSRFFYKCNTKKELINYLKQFIEVDNQEIYIDV